MRKKIAAGNWKMYKTVREAREFFKQWEELVAAVEVKEGVKLAKDPAHAVATTDSHSNIVFFPSSILLSVVAESTLDQDVEFGPQNISWQKEGAFTG